MWVVPIQRVSSNRDLRVARPRTACGHQPAAVHFTYIPTLSEQERWRLYVVHIILLPQKPETCHTHTYLNIMNKNMVSTSIIK